ncbi:hypothetical protein OH491_23740 [Termitidicoccus mucosus]|uniref:Uncharacterized protein n=1 Tax=Termitidicoccus mucosus TaxID=1184151 RepID=A0A178INQ3_9BACT|nr:hypothetical protein AW736_02750 [Opitutaceae bacterium TSB47]
MKNKTETLISSLPMVRYAFIVRGHLAGGSRVTIMGHVHARKEMYYQAQARALDSILKDIPAFELDREYAIGLRMYGGKRGRPAGQ